MRWPKMIGFDPKCQIMLHLGVKCILDSKYGMLDADLPLQWSHWTFTKWPHVVLTHSLFGFFSTTKKVNPVSPCTMWVTPTCVLHKMHMWLWLTAWLWDFQRNEYEKKQEPIDDGYEALHKQRSTKLIHWNVERNLIIPYQTTLEIARALPTPNIDFEDAGKPSLGGLSALIVGQ